MAAHISELNRVAEEYLRQITPKPQVSNDTLFHQYLLAVVTSWRKNNRWADGIPFSEFPAAYKKELQYTAAMKMEIGGYR